MRVRLGDNLRDRLRVRFYGDAFCDALGKASGLVVEAPRVWRGPTGLAYAYNVVLPDGITYHLGALYADEVES